MAMADNEMGWCNGGEECRERGLPMSLDWTRLRRRSGVTVDKRNSYLGCEMIAVENYNKQVF